MLMIDISGNLSRCCYMSLDYDWQCFISAWEEMYFTNQHHSTLFHVLQQTSKLSKWLSCVGKHMWSHTNETQMHVQKLLPEIDPNMQAQSNTLIPHKILAEQKSNNYGNKAENTSHKRNWLPNQVTTCCWLTDVHLIIGQSVTDEIKLEWLKGLGELLHC